VTGRGIRGRDKHHASSASLAYDTDCRDRGQATSATRPHLHAIGYVGSGFAESHWRPVEKVDSGKRPETSKRPQEVSLGCGGKRPRSLVRKTLSGEEDRRYRVRVQA